MKTIRSGSGGRRISGLILFPVFVAAVVGLTVLILGAYEIHDPAQNSEAYSSLGRWTSTVQSLDQPEAGTFLIAARGMLDPNFAQTVVLLIDYDAQGAFGLIINRPTRYTLAELWPEITGLEARSVYFGGPVFPNRLLFLLRSKDAPQDMRRVILGVYLGSDELTLKRIIAKGEEEFRTYAGYSGWGPGQLDNEIARGDWFIIPAEKRFIFDSQPAEVWNELIQRVDTQVAKMNLNPSFPCFPCKEAEGTHQMVSNTRDKQASEKGRL